MDDIFGTPSDTDSPLPRAGPPAAAPPRYTSALDEDFDEIFGAPAPLDVAKYSSSGASPTQPSANTATVASNIDDFEDIFGDAAPAPKVAAITSSSTPSNNSASADIYGISDDLKMNEVESSSRRAARTSKSPHRDAGLSNVSLGDTGGSFAAEPIGGIDVEKSEKKQIREWLDEGGASESLLSKNATISPTKDAVPSSPAKVSPQARRELSSAEALEELRKIAAGDGNCVVDVENVRSLCVQLGTSLPPDLRPQIWGILLGQGPKPGDAIFDSWVMSGKGYGGGRKAEDPEIVDNANKLAESLVAGGYGSSIVEVMADVYNVTVYYTERRQVAYEPLISCLVAPLLALGIGASAASALLYPLISVYTMFIDRGLSSGARALAEELAHRQFQLLAAYHSPLLVQHLDRCYPGWEMAKSKSSKDIKSPGDGIQISDTATDLVEEEQGPTAMARVKRLTGLVPSAMLGGICACSATLPGGSPMSDLLLPLWDYFFIRHDKLFGYFLLLVLLKRSEKELLKLQGKELKDLLEDVLSGSKALNVDAAGDSNTNIIESVHKWCLEGEALDLATPESFRHQVRLIGELALEEHERELARIRNIADKIAAEVPTDEDTKSMVVEPGVASSAPISLFELPPAAPTSHSRPGSFNMIKMKALMADASAKMAASMENLKLPNVSQTPTIAKATMKASPMAEMAALRPLCLNILPQEMIASIGRPEGRGEQTSPPVVVPGSPASYQPPGGSSLHRPREPLRYFVVDCRTEEEVSKGRFPTAYQLEPGAMSDPEQISQLLEVFQPLVGRAHICLLGAGDAYLYSQTDGTSPQSTTVQATASTNVFDSFASHNRSESSTAPPSPITPGGGTISARSARMDYSSVNSFALFLIKRGFPYVSVVLGGFASAHDVLAASGEENPKGNLSTLVDHSPRVCRHCARANGGTTEDSGAASAKAFKASAEKFVRVLRTSLGNSPADAPPPPPDPSSNSGTSPIPPPGTEPSEKPLQSNRSGTGSPPLSRAFSGANFAEAFSTALRRAGSMTPNPVSSDTNNTTNESNNVPSTSTNNEGGASTSSAVPRPFSGSFSDFQAAFRRSSSTPVPPVVSVSNTPTTAFTEGATTNSNSNERGNAEERGPKALPPSTSGEKEGQTRSSILSPPPLTGAFRAFNLRKPRMSQDSVGSSGAGGGMFVIGDGEDSDNEDSTDQSVGSIKKASSQPKKAEKTEAEKRLALAEHSLSGMLKGAPILLEDYSMIPGAQVFPVRKYPIPPVPAAASTSETPTSPLKPAVQPPTTPQILIPRYLFLTRERLMILDCPEGTHAQGAVKSNRHLTDLQRMTFKKSDPVVVTFHYRSGKKKLYRLASEVQKETLILSLQTALQRFNS